MALQTRCHFNTILGDFSRLRCVVARQRDHFCHRSKILKDSKFVNLGHAFYPKTLNMTIYTAGYEGTEITAFATFLKSKKIKLVIDIRKTPLSRKKGFSKRKLAENLKLKGLDYSHMPGLGVPGEWRKLAKSNFISREKMFDDYVKKILPLHQQELDEIISKSKETTVALLCFESDALDCHRSFVTSNLKRKVKSLKIVHLKSLGMKIKAR